MKRAPFVLAIIFAIWTVPVFAQSYKVAGIEVDHPWVRATPRGAELTAGYFRIINSGTTADRLVGGSSVAALRFEIHEMTTVDGVMRMRPLTAGLEIKPGATVELKPGSFHAMLVGLKQPLKQGTHIKGTLVFEKAGSLEVEYSVESIGAQQPMSPMNQH